ncbi:MAG: hypothetical protein RL748_2693 [Pseudomonadota bacterium]|jgi:plasmid stabilization system protein ParE
MMQVKWASKARSDLAGLVEYLSAINRYAAREHAKLIIEAVSRLRTMPRMGEQLDQFLPAEVRRILVKQYEVRYEIHGATVFIARIRHTREAR